MAHRVRPIDPRADAEIDLVAARMRETLVEVLGEARGGSMYTMEWLRQRVLFHLDPRRSTAQVFLAEDVDGAVTGHTIVRVERGDDGRAFGLFSTTFVAPAWRRRATATALLLRGEAWMIDQGLPEAATWTSDANVKLIALYRKHGYAIVELGKDETGAGMVRLAKPLAAPAAPPQK